ncbi:MAG: hypothetical protein Kow0031_35540 [Anaerolineae bacterium]
MKFLRVSLMSLLLLFLTGRATAAHPLDEFYQVTFLSVGAERVSLIVELYAGILAAPQVIELIDTDGDGQFSAAEEQAFAELFVDDLTLTLDGAAVPLGVEQREFSPLLEVQAGSGVIRLFLSGDFAGAGPGPHQLFYDNNHQPERSLYIVNAISADPQRAEITNQERDVFQKSATLAVQFYPPAEAAAAPSAATPTPAPPAPASEPETLPAGAPTEGQRWLTGYLYRAQLPLWLVGVVLLASVALGGLHALTPGHGKTLVAAYLIGSRGTVQHAVFLGGIVTFTHTASVIVIGLLALLASQYIVPDVLVPAMEVLSGLLVVYIGGQLMLARWRDFRGGAAPPGHHPHHDDDHPHHHHHHHDIPEGVTVRDLLTLGISGGLVPCPEALGIMVIAIGLNRIALGLSMVVAFSFGLAAVLIAIGILLVRAKNFLESASRAGQRWQNLLPLVSAVIVTLLGLGIVLKGLWPWLTG